MNQNELEGLLMMNPISRASINNALTETLESINEAISISNSIDNEDNNSNFIPKNGKDPFYEKNLDKKHGHVPDRVHHLHRTKHFWDGKWFESCRDARKTNSAFVSSGKNNNFNKRMLEHEICETINEE